jgi:hypothetical protein
MAITRAQQVKQMLRKGGRSGYRFGGGYQGSDAKTGQGGASKGPSGGGKSSGGGGGSNKDDNRQTYSATQTVKKRPKVKRPTKDKSDFSGVKQIGKTVATNTAKNLAAREIAKKLGLGAFNLFGLGLPQLLAIGAVGKKAIKDIRDPQITEDVTLGDLEGLEGLDVSQIRPSPFETMTPRMQVAELTQKQKDFLSSPKVKFSLQEGILTPKQVFEKLPSYEEKGIFGIGGQEPTTPQEFNEYLQSQNLPTMQVKDGGRIGVMGGGMLVQPGFGGTRQGYRGDDAYGDRPGSSSSSGGGGNKSGGSGGGGGGGNDKDDNRQTYSAQQTQRPTKIASDLRDDRKKTTPGDRGREAQAKFLLNTARGLSELRKRGVSQIPTGFPGSSVLNMLTPFRNYSLRKNIDYFRGLEKIKTLKDKLGRDLYPETEQGYRDYMRDRLAGKIDAAGNLKAGFMRDASGNIMSTGNDGRDDSVIIPTTTTPVDVGETASEEDPFGIPYRFFADGGMPEDAPVGGIMDIESGRQMYFLGKLVKKAKRAVSKIVKSPLGKAALIGGLGYLGATKLGGFAGIKSKLFGSALPGALGRDAFMGMAGKTGSKGILAKLGLTKGFGDFGLTGKGMLALGGLGLTALPFLTGDEEEDQMMLDRGPGLNIAQIRRDAILNPGAVYGNAFRLYGNSGGRAAFQKGGDAEPVAKETMPLLKMGGKEMDLRDNGGFVPIGRMERADDVPARLSKNEFVFTADAVRNAGGGDIDKGAEVMYNTMKNLEAGGEVSEETQGLDGARNMFQTAKRLEEVL